MFRPGDTLGKYKIVREIGHGGMAYVFEAQDTTLSRPVAIKVLTRKDNKNSMARFQQEAKIAAKLQHPNIVTTFEVADDGSYIVMEYLKGESLDDVLKREKVLNFATAIKICQEVGEALTHAHETEGIVHRDVKPANILISKNGHAKLTDFGISRILEEDNNLTADGNILGTPQYMSPEQINGAHNVDHRSDVYSLGIVVYQMFTGEGIFGSTSIITEVIRKQLQPYIPRRPSDINRNISPEMEQVILKSLESDPNKRFQTTKQFAEALAGAYQREISQEKLIKKENPSNFRMIMLGLGAMLLVLIVLIGALGWIIFNLSKNDGTDITTPIVETTKSIDSCSITLTTDTRLRAGPGNIYDELKIMPTNTSLTIMGKDAEGKWWEVQSPDKTIGWISVTNLTPTCDLAKIPLAVIPPTPTSPAITTKLSETATVAPSPTFTPAPSTATPAPTSTPTETEDTTPIRPTPQPPGKSCPVELKSPIDFAPFTSAEEIKLEWISPGRLGSGESYRLSFRRTDDTEINALITNEPFSIKKAGDDHWKYQDGQWIAGIEQNSNYKWSVNVVDKDNNVLCSSSSRTFIWNLARN